MKKKNTKNPEPEVVREYLIGEAIKQKEFLTEQESMIRGWSEKNDNLYLGVADNYRHILQHVADNLLLLNSETNTEKKEGEKIDR
jgi:hypothetical protein